MMERKSVYFLGIGGIGMSALARYFLHERCRVGGYDRTRTRLTDQLEAEGAAVHYEDDVRLIPAEFLDPARTIVVYTPAVPYDHSEYTYFREHGFRIEKRSQMLGHLSEGKYVMAVAGTHGKTTTSTLIAWLNRALTGGGSAFLGGVSKNFDGNLVQGDGKRLAVEADEFDRSFLHLYPDVAVVTSADPDHLDIYGTREAYLESYRHYTTLIRPGGALIIHRGLALQPEVQDGVTVYTYSRDEGDFHAKNIRIGGGEITLDFVAPRTRIKGIRLGVPVSINIENGVAAMALAHLSGATDEEIKRGMETFQGVERRFDFKLKTDHSAVLSDYAHHPAEIAQSIRSVRELYKGRKITVAFQPHLYTRTRDFYREFAESLSLADEVILTDIYPAREAPIPGISSLLIYNLLRPGIEKRLCRKDEVAELVGLEDIEVLIILGAGDLDNYAADIAQKLAAKG